MMQIDHTHDPALTSWVTSANGHSDFPVQNLPLGVFSPRDGVARGGVAIGDQILDLSAAVRQGLFEGDAKRAAEQASKPSLNSFLALNSSARRALRHRLSQLLAATYSKKNALEPLLYGAAEVTMHLPAIIGDYTDFYVGIHHATNVGSLFRPDNPLLPNYKYVPIGYHGRASSIRPSGTPVRRPAGQVKLPDSDRPVVRPTERLDIELELGVWIGPGNESGHPIALESAWDHIGGFCLLNDWSARDIQAWEYQPLGPFLSKSFASTVSPWVIMPEALAPFRTSQPMRPEGDPDPLPYLADAEDQSSGALNIGLEVLLVTPELQRQGLAPHRIAISGTQHMYWTVGQMIAHHTMNGCNLRPGDFLGSGTLSGPDLQSCGSLLEATQGGKTPLRLPTGEERRFLEDGDEIILKAHARRSGFASIGLGECRARVMPAR